MPAPRRLFREWIFRFTPARPNRRRRTTRRRLSLESMEQRNLLAADLEITSFHADGQHLIVEYDIHNDDAAPFNITFYSSSDGAGHDSVLQTVRVENPADLAQGAGRQFIIDVDFADLPGDYRLIAALDAGEEIAEANETDNEMAFEGGVFHNSDNVVQVHGTDGDDVIVVADDTMQLSVTLNGQPVFFTSGGPSDVQVRSHDGDDQMSADYYVATPLAAFGGEGNDLLQGGSAADMLAGGAGHDEIFGGWGDDSLFGDAGDDILNGEEGDDTADGGEGTDVVDGEPEGEEPSGYRPIITYFYATDYYGMLWEISGTVTNFDNYQVATVTISGAIPETTVSIDQFGNFMWTSSSPISGFLEAVAKNESGLESEVAETYA